MLNDKLSKKLKDISDQVQPSVSLFFGKAILKHALLITIQIVFIAGMLLLAYSAKIMLEQRIKVLRIRLQENSHFANIQPSFKWKIIGPVHRFGNCLVSSLREFPCVDAYQMI